MKKIVFFAVLFVILATVVTTSPAVAEKPLLTNALHNSSSAGEVKQTTNTSNLQQRATQEITRRITSLKNLLTRISGFKKLSSTEKATLTSEVQAQIDSLTALQTKIAGDTDTTTLKTDVQSIVQSYRIYAVFMPQIEILGAADRLLTTTDVMSSYSAQLQTKVTDKQSAGKDVTDLQTLLSDMNTKITDAKAQAQNAIDTVTPLTPDGYPGNKTQLQNGRQMVVTGIKDLNTAQQDARKIIWGLLKFGKITSESSATTTITPETTSTPPTQ